MTHTTTFLLAGPLTLNATFIVELVGFLLMVLFLTYVPLPFLGIPKPVFPWIVSVAEARQREITSQLDAARKDREEAEARLKEAEAKLEDARRTAQGVIDSAGRSAEQLRQELRQKGDEERRRAVDAARKEIEAERERAVQSVRGEVANLVIAATEKVIGETLDDDRQRKLIDTAISEVASGAE
ncbi:MAG TPA: F0F1 ATP synthase subunit B [Candidatus Dormibacteraeota bacterium]